MSSARATRAGNAVVSFCLHKVTQDPRTEGASSSLSVVLLLVFTKPTTNSTTSTAIPCLLDLCPPLSIQALHNTSIPFFHPLIRS